MLIEGYIAIVSLALLLVFTLIAWADSLYHAERRRRRIAQRFGNQDV